MMKHSYLAFIAMLFPFMALSQINEYTAGERVPVTLTARDSLGNVISDWDQSGTNTILTLHNSTANTDTSNRSWNDDPDGYSWAMFYHNGQPLTQLSEYEWQVPASIFLDGVSHLELTHTRAWAMVFYTAYSPDSAVHYKSDTMTFHAGEITNFLIDITCNDFEHPFVYEQRKYEISVWPRDRYLNISNKQVLIRFLARFPMEFVPGSSYQNDVFTGQTYITGPTNYFLSSNTVRRRNVNPLQWISAHSVIDSTITGQSNGFEVLNHAPQPFQLLNPPDGTILDIHSPSNRVYFDWRRSHDIYNIISISRFTSEPGNDIVRYSIHFVDSASLARSVRFFSGNNGLDTTWTSYTDQLVSMMHYHAGFVHENTMVWTVEATDDLYISQNIDPHPNASDNGFYLHVIDNIPTGIHSLNGIVSSFRLHQNYPNPFNPSTTIQFEIIERGYVTLKVFDLVGNEVATLANETLDPGVYSAEFNASGMASGVYHYTLTAGNNTVTKSMVVEK